MLARTNNSISNMSTFDILNSFLDGVPIKTTTAPTMLPVDIEELNKEYCITAEVPGIAKENINITLDKNKLTLKINETEKNKKQITDYIYKERKIYTGSWSIDLPDNITEKAIKVTLRNGLLYITIQKKEKVTIKKIAIN